ncbi:carboxylesterase/lipase family protein [Hyphococcus luteus]|nr:carboxylesterase family protein [Marinicaulis flavus]
MIFRLAALALAFSPYGAAAEPPGAPTVKTEAGLIEGTAASKPGVSLFGSIPYAAPPVGPLRWRPPQAAPRWDDRTLAADRLPPACPQVPTHEDSIAYAFPHEQSEDCLYLNIWTGDLSSSARRPVMVWLYGGGFMQGSSAAPAYDGAALAQRGVVFVSVNYRIGALGFMAHPELSAESAHKASGNYGILDQIAALDWVRRNIAAFGGDPGNVTVIGQSAGSMSLNLLTASPLATGLFHKGIGETGAVMGMLSSKPLREAEAKGVALADKLGARSIKELRAMDAATIVQAAGAAPGAFEPNIDGWVLPASSASIYRNAKQNDVPLLIGSNRDENQTDPTVTAESYFSMLTAFFGEQRDDLLELYPAVSNDEARASSRRLFTIAMAQYPMNLWARLQNSTGTAPVYVYRFTRPSPVPPNRYLEQRATPDLGAWHGSEIVYALDNLSVRDWPWQAADRRFSDMMASYWVNFAKTGDPNGASLPTWPAFSSDTSMVMELGENIGPIREPNLATFKILDRRYSIKP